MKVVAIISAYNEADIVVPLLDHLSREGISAYLLDHESTDGTADTARPFLGRGLLAIEPFPNGARFSNARGAFAWQAILSRKEELARELDADWFIHHDADEFRESPWELLTLVEAIGRVDRLGYNAIDFELFNFWPTDDAFRAGDDPRAAFRHFEPGRHWDKRQIKCWKKQNAAVDLVSSGGHDVAFPGRRVFPLRFILRHYPIRGQAHGARKVFVERRPRFLADELDLGWHVQYGDVTDGQPFLRDPSTLVEYDPDAARLALVLRHRGVESLEAALVAAANHAETQANRISSLSVERDHLLAEHERLLSDISALQSQMVAERVAADRVAREMSAALVAERDIVKRLVRDIEAQQRELEAMRSSKSWRWTASLRALFGFVGPTSNR